jgi:GGDEF domain-containing protein
MPDQQNNVLPEEHFVYLLEHECKCAQRFQYFFSLLMIKFENLDSQPTFLTEIPNPIKNVIRDSDTIGAIQSDKLAILLRYTDNQNSIAKRIVNKIQSEIPHNNTKVGEVCFPDNATTAQDLLRVCLGLIP